MDRAIPSNGLRADVLQVLATWTPAGPDQARLADAYRDFVTAEPDAVWRRCVPGHVTASTLLLSAERDRVLLTLHPKFGRWLQLGGHCEPDDTTLAGAALREAREESGLDGIALLPGPVRLDRHRVGCHGGSWHYDVQYAALAPRGACPRTSAESLALAWFPVDALPADCDESVRALVATTRALVGG